MSTDDEALPVSPRSRLLVGRVCRSRSASTGFWLEVLLGGLMTGVLYSLVALGLVLIFKASGVFNFAQGAMVLFAALSLVRSPMDPKMPPWQQDPRRLLASPSRSIMVALAWLIERLVLRPLVNQEGVVAADGDARRHLLPRRLRPDAVGQRHLQDRRRHAQGADDPVERLFEGGILVNKEDVVAAVIAATLVVALVLFFQKTATGRALRAVADDHQAAQSIGIPLNRIWVIVWSVAGFVALVAGVDLGLASSACSSRSPVALKALPVVILGGFTSIPGAIVGGLIIGAGREDVRGLPRARCSAAASRTGSPTCSRCCSCWSGPKACSAKRSSTGSDTMIYRENGQFKTTYASDQQMLPILQDRVFMIGVARVRVRRGAVHRHRLPVPRRS